MNVYGMGQQLVESALSYNDQLRSASGQQNDVLNQFEKVLHDIKSITLAIQPSFDLNGINRGYMDVCADEFLNRIATARVTGNWDEPVKAVEWFNEAVEVLKFTAERTS